MNCKRKCYARREEEPQEGFRSQKKLMKENPFEKGMMSVKVVEVKG